MQKSQLDRQSNEKILLSLLSYYTQVQIYSPARSASQQGLGKIGRWKIGFDSTSK